MEIEAGEPYVSLYPYRGKNSEELTFEEGDVVLVLEDIDQSMSYGTCLRTGSSGIFPKKCLIESNDGYMPIAPEETLSLPERVSLEQEARNQFDGKVRQHVLTHQKQLRQMVNVYLGDLERMLWNECDLVDPSVIQTFLQKERKRLEGVEHKVFRSDDKEVEMEESPLQLGQKVMVDDFRASISPMDKDRSIRIVQSHIRGYLTRKQYKDQYKQLKSRRNILYEILVTERTYLSNLKVLIDHYKAPLLTQGFITEEESHVLFSNTELIIGVSKAILSALEERLDPYQYTSKVAVGDIFLRLAPFLKLYAQYINTFDDASHFYEQFVKEEEHAAFIHSCRADSNVALDFLSLQILPVQRVPRYHLLLEELHRHTGEDHPDWENLGKAVDMIKAVASNINESKRRFENRNKILAIEREVNDYPGTLVAPHREYVFDGLVKMDETPGGPDTHTRRKIRLYLFNDMLLMVSRKQGIFLDRVMLGNVYADALPGEPMGFCLRSEYGTIQRFYAPTVALKLKWVKLITDISKLVMSRKMTLRVDEAVEVGEINEVQDAPQSVVEAYLAAMEGALELEADLFSPMIELNKMIPETIVVFTPEKLDRLRIRLRCLQDKLQVILSRREYVDMKGKALKLWNEFDVKLIETGKTELGSLYGWVKRNVPQEKEGVGLRAIAAHLLQWYLECCEEWKAIRSTLG